MATTKKSAESAAEMEPVLMHAVIQSKAKTAEATAETRAAKSLSVQLIGVVRSLPLARTWRVQLPEGDQGALVVLADTATSADRERFARAAEALHAAGEMDGVLPVRRIAPSRDAFLTDLIITGTAEDLPVLAWPLRKQLEFVLRALRSLDALHRARIVHGCLCSANVLLADDLNPILSEAGTVSVAAVVSRGPAVPYATFAAPEIRQGADPDARSDIYSAGRLIQEVTGASAPPRAILDIVTKCTAPDQGIRYRSARELVEAVQNALHDLPREAPAPTLPRPPTPGPIEPRPPARRESPAVAETHGGQARKERARSKAPWIPPTSLGIAGIALVAASLAAAALLGGASDAMRPLLMVAAPLGSALATTLLPALSRGAGLGRLALALSSAALVYFLDPLAIAYRIAAQARMHGDDATRRAAILEVMRLGRDFRGLSFAGASLPGVDLTAADLRRGSFADADLTGAHLYAAEIYGTSFANAQLAGADLQGTTLQLADTTGARCDETTKLPSGWRCETRRLVRSGPVAP